ncbi:MAG: hypothetical protein G3M70_11165 [Candidatus Nitronauta litoralis]|uniref:Baseplate protein J-like domain-containing protein n=1 Tax=Candidatus Nitronauta litoralis TaxID=2705533 RepID=A0A7T0BWT5_9BACT|nr:MAG: hypothetical protein G3M70_11165 [Candidatus Nitronauta litoralis]
MVVSRDKMLGCKDERRSGVLRNPDHPLNGIDFVEFRKHAVGPKYRLEVTFLKPLPAAPALTDSDFEILGGVRVVGIKVEGIDTVPGEPARLTVFVSEEGDFSNYILRVSHPEMDLERSEARFGFRTGCPTEFDCRVNSDCPPEIYDEPALDYQAKDYQSFRRLMIDLIDLRNPGWQERLPADLGMALVELLAYAGDYLSYFQDAGPGTESYLDTCLHRISARRHARLIDYRMHNGRNAVTYIHFEAQNGTNGIVPAGTLLTTKISHPLIGETAPPAAVIPVTAQFDSDPALTGATLFETTTPIEVDSLHNELRIHTWNDTLCCLGKGTTQVYLYALTGNGPIQTAERPNFKEGDYLLLEEILSPSTGVKADADKDHRQVVRITSVNDETVDAAFTNEIQNGELTPRLNPPNPGDPFPPALPLQLVTWDEVDGLNFPLCLSAQADDGDPIGPVAVARGNIAPADHGRTVRRDSQNGEVGLPGGESSRILPLLPLPDAPLTHQGGMPNAPRFTSEGKLIQGRHDLFQPAYKAEPAVTIKLKEENGDEEWWTPVPNLLDSGPYDIHFVAEVDNNGQAILRFGDDQYGRRPKSITQVQARYRIGNGTSGNIGRESLVHVVQPTPEELQDPENPGVVQNFAAIENVYQPLVASLGTQPESIEEVRQQAPEAFRAIMYRAVTVEDWQEAAMRHEGVAGAKARFRWTGSWHTVFVAIHPRKESNLVRLPGGGLTLAKDFEKNIKSHLVPFKLAGYDLKVKAAIYVPLEIDIRLCVSPGNFRGDILRAVSERLSNKQFADGARGFFHLLEFNFGDPVYLSKLYAAIEEIPGVESARVEVFKRYWFDANDELEKGRIPMGPFEIPQLDNDPNFPENGVLRLTAVGGQ